MTHRDEGVEFVLHEITNALKHDMVRNASQPSVKVVGTNGQVSLGKQYAGRQVLVEEREPGVWLIRTATVIPDNERWLHEGSVAANLARAIDWAERHPPSEAGTDELLGGDAVKRNRRRK